ncbi:MAG: phosphatidylglycerophosphatase A [Kiritimatiellia bacterium]
MFRKATLLLATGFGLGLCPFASGTAGTLLGIPIALAAARFNWLRQAAGAAVLILLAVPVCGVAEKVFGIKDDGRIVADEYLTFPLCVVGLPLIEAPWLIASAFAMHRLADVVKPPPARGIQSVRGGWGIVLDDVIASLYALVLNHGIWLAVKTWL